MKRKTKKLIYSKKAIDAAADLYKGKRVAVINPTNKFYGKLGEVKSISYNRFFPDKYWIEVLLDGQDKSIFFGPNIVKLQDGNVN